MNDNLTAYAPCDCGVWCYGIKLTGEKFYNELTGYTLWQAVDGQHCECGRRIGIIHQPPLSKLTIDVSSMVDKFKR